MSGICAEFLQASQNETAVRNLRLGLFIPTLLSFLLRFLFRKSSLPPSKTSLAIYFMFSAPAWLVSNYLTKIGATRRDPTTKTLISSGEDLNQPGVTEWCFDVIYITYLCQVGSGAFGERFWWLYAIIPVYASYMLFTKIISPFFLGRSASSGSEDSGKDESATSKRQEKLKKRNERGQAQTKIRGTR
ncbi:hypothetical protein DL96DRAFT_1707490 [Flagelloscypha sp. PMI_526]|nr:hypothetical protein DL96DRAFT_1707490 [Flagelloscypha sp. PMI_526]